MNFQMFNIYIYSLGTVYILIIFLEKFIENFIFVFTKSIAFLQNRVGFVTVETSELNSSLNF